MSDDSPPAGPRPAAPFGAVPPELPAAERVPPPPEAPRISFDGPTLSPPPPPPAADSNAGRPLDPYPMHFSVAYPARLSRLSTLLRAVLILPAWVLGVLVVYMLYFAAPIGWLAVLFRRSYPVWLYQGAGGALAWAARLQAYGWLLTDRFPSLDPEGSPVRLTYDQPARGSLSWWRVVVWKWVLLGPHFFVLWILGFAALVVTTLAWFAIVFTGRYPRGLFGFVSGVLGWHFRVAGYLLSFNDRFPPFALSAQAGPASRGATIASGLVGLAATAGFVAIIAAAAALETGEQANVDYERLKRGQADAPRFFLGAREDPSFVVGLTRVTDPAPEIGRALGVSPATRVVSFTFSYVNRQDTDRAVVADQFRLRYRFSEEGGEPFERTRQASFAELRGTLTPTSVRGGSNATVIVVFTVPADATPLRLTVDPPWEATGTLKYDFR